eukprot:SM000171S03221  [mRNA]  locus=s171:26379:30719:- [translate_table: standard]
MAASANRCAVQCGDMRAGGSGRRRLPASALLAAALLAALAGAATSQQQTPLLGQGVSPFGAGLVTNATPVYMSVVLEKLFKVDAKNITGLVVYFAEINYSFEVVMTVVTTWRDPRAEELINGLVLSSVVKQNIAVSKQSQCSAYIAESNYNYTDGMSFNSTNTTCNAATEKVNSVPCDRYCFPWDQTVCCDAVWVPGFRFGNVLAYSQDRYVEDMLNPGATPNAGIRQTQVQGLFSTPLSFQRFPFDKQKLIMQIQTTDSDYYIVPSITAKDQALSVAGRRLKGAGKSYPSDDLAGWKILQIYLKCDPQLDCNSSELWQKADPDDPLVDILKAQSEECGKQLSIKPTSCEIVIVVERLSYFYIWNIIFPVMITVALAFVAFFASPVKLELRLNTTVTLFLALTATQFVVDGQVPKTSYLTAFHKMVLLSYIIIVLIVCECTFVHYITTLDVKRTRLGKEVLKKLGMMESAATSSSIQGGSSRQASMPLVDEDQELEGGSVSKPKGDGGGPSAAKGTKLRRSRSLRRTFCSVGPAISTTWRTIRRHQTSLAASSTQAFRLASLIDTCFLVLLPLLYFVGALLIFACS